MRVAPAHGFQPRSCNANACGLGSSSIIVRMSAIRKPAVAAIDNRLLAPELAAGIARVKSAKSIGVRTVNRLPAGAGAPERAGHRDHPGAARLRALSGRIHGGGDGRRTARECAGAVGIGDGRLPACDLRPCFGTPAIRTLDGRGDGQTGRLAPEWAAGIARGKSALLNGPDDH